MFKKKPQKINTKPRRPMGSKRRRKLNKGQPLSGGPTGQGSPTNLIAWVIIGISMVILAVAVAGPLWIPAAANLIPDRYVAAYAPEWFSEAAFDADPLAELPTAASVDDSEVDELLAGLEDPTATPPPTASPAPTTAAETDGSSSTGGGYVAPTSVAIAPTPTVTPAPTTAAGVRATDGTGNANLGEVTHLLTGFTHTYQGWNNCGPASFTTTLSYWGEETTQTQAASFLKPHPEDRNVRPEEMVAYADSLGYQMTVRVNGDIETIQRLLQAGYPVMIEKGFDPEPDRLGWMGHYLVLVGYSESGQQFIAMDSYLGPDRAISFENLDRFWRHFNRTYMVVYREGQAAAVASILGDQMNDQVMWEGALRQAQAEINVDRDDPFAWFNLGSSLVAMERYEEAATAFDKARDIGLPWRMLWYQYGPYEAYLAVGGDRLEDVVTLAGVILQENPYSEEAYYYRAMAYAAQGNPDAAQQQLYQALRFNQNYEQARLALEALEE